MRGRTRGDWLGAFHQGRVIIVRLKEMSPDNATLPKNLAWFNGQITALESR